MMIRQEFPNYIINYICLSNSNSGLNRDSSHQAKWDQVVVWADNKLVDMEINEDNTGISHVSEMWIGMNELS